MAKGLHNMPCDRDAAYDRGNVFAKILRGELPARTLYEDEYALVFPDISPAAPVHALAIPKLPCCDFGHFTQTAGPEGVGRFFESVRAAAEDTLGLLPGGYRLICNTGADAYQTVFHFHVHILGGRKLGGLLPHKGGAA